MGNGTKGVAVLIALSALSACGSVDPSGPPRKVPGTSAQVNGERVGPLHVGQYVGQLESVQDGEACRGTAGSGATGSTRITLRTDGQCRVWVQAIEPE